MQKVIFVLLIATVLKVSLVQGFSRKGLTRGEHAEWPPIDFHTTPSLLSPVEALRCVKCDSETGSCASPDPEIVECSGKCFTYHTVDRVDGTLVTDLQKGCYPIGDVETSCSCEACDKFQTVIQMFTDGKVDWSCKHHCCDDRDECNQGDAPTCNEHSVSVFLWCEWGFIKDRNSSPVVQMKKMKPGTSVVCTVRFSG